MLPVEIPSPCPPAARGACRPVESTAVASRRTRTGLPALLLSLVLSLPALPALAEKGDRDKPINIEADRVQVDDVKQESIFTGNVQITQGTLVIRGERVIVRQDKQGFNYGIAFGGPKAQAYFRQKRDGVDEFVEGWADRLEYDGRKEIVQFFTRARLLRGADEVRGDFMVYEMQTEVFRVVGGGKSAATGNNPEGRVRAVIQPKPKEAPDKAPAGAAAEKQKPPSMNIKPSPSIANPRE
ncbi:MAG: lipopolysaccharide transport periplasmic protein LptA [Burkholderiales bacterium]|jgi:lipopolysaccharide export system protein LptA|nr:lipopolysaccharide transport periplasmic protein LptA [Burkholderiales bacterium]